MQDVLETAAMRLTGGAPVSSVVAGRTDAGVHAEAQVAQLELGSLLPANRLREALNYHMKPHPVAVLRAAPAPEGWNARFSAIGRAYRYRILNRRARPALLAGRVWHVHAALDAAAMHAAAQTLLGRHDFTSFRAAACQAKSPLRTLDRLDVTRDGDMIEIVAEARSFLHHQVRNMVGTLKLVGDGQLDGGAGRRRARRARPLRRRADRAGGGAVPDRGALSGRSVRVRRSLSRAAGEAGAKRRVRGGTHDRSVRCAAHPRCCKSPPLPPRGRGAAAWCLVTEVLTSCGVRRSPCSGPVRRDESLGGWPQSLRFIGWSLEEAAVR